jgi:hypothetical protein
MADTILPATDRRRRGSALVESSLVLMLLLTLLIGVFDCGQLVLLHATLADRMRQALRYGSLHADDLHGIQNIILYGDTADRASSGSFGLSREGVSVVRASPGSNEDRLTIRVSGYSVRFLTPGAPRTAIGRPVIGVIPVEAP